ncbi:MAG: hypothetical protein AAFN77_06480 [Planctomycetota bacterium]
MKLKIAAVALFCSVAMMCSESNADLLGRMLGRGGCGGCQAVSSCCDTPAPTCGGRNFGISININIGMPGRLFRGNNCGGGCGLFSGGGLLRGRGGACDSGCGGAVVSNVADSCGTCGGNFADGGCGCGGGRVRDLLGRVRGRLSSIGSCGCGGGLLSGGSCGGGCGMAAPAPSCGPTCDDGCGSGLFSGGLLGRLRGGLGGGCGCGSAIDAGCGCGMAAPAPAPVMNFGGDCGCDACGSGGKLRGRVSGLLSRLKPSFGNGCGMCGSSAGDCGCGAPVYAAPAVDMGCNDGCGSGCGSNLLGRVRNLGQGVGSRLFARCGSCGRTSCDGGCDGARLSLLSRLRGDRTLRNSCNDGCQPACPNSGCGGSCGTGAVQYDGGMNYQPMQAAPQMQTAPQLAPVPQSIVPNQVAPQAVPAETKGAIEVPAATQPDGAYRQPVVDPSAFVIKK